jgi:O-methyltransferase
MDIVSMRRQAQQAILRVLDVHSPRPDSPPDFDQEFLDLVTGVEPFTMTSQERVYGLREAADYILREGIPGDWVECGVWRGGSAMVMALRLLAAGDMYRTLWLYDTFARMVAPGERDEPEVHERYAATRARGEWVGSPVDDVRRNLLGTGFPPDRIEVVEDKVEDTIPARASETIGLRRLDTDWYDSTRDELEHLWDRLSHGGVLIIDDYGHWRGAREAVDEFFEKCKSRPLFARLDHTGRILVKR